MRASAAVLLIALLATLGATPAAAPVVHDLAQVHLDVSFNPDGTYAIDLYSPPEWLWNTLEPLSPSPSTELLEGEARERRLAELAPVLAEWVWIIFDGVRLAGGQARIHRAARGAARSDQRADGGCAHSTGEIPAGASRGSSPGRCGVCWDARTPPILAADAKGTTITHWVEGPCESVPLRDRRDHAARRRGRWSQPTWCSASRTSCPKGLDHILFVLGIFLLSTRLRPLLVQVTAFTVAHSVTLGLTIYGVVSLPSAIVEPLIALSIAYVAVENCSRRSSSRGGRARVRRSACCTAWDSPACCASSACRGRSVSPRCSASTSASSSASSP